jgi:hypothetical protein
MEKQEKQFAKGFIFKRNDNAPEWAIGKLSIKAQEAIQFINEKNNSGWVNLEIKKSKEGKFYIELDTYEAKAKVEVKEVKEENLPF